MADTNTVARVEPIMNPGLVPVVPEPHWPPPVAIEERRESTALREAIAPHDEPAPAPMVVAAPPAPHAPQAVDAPHGIADQLARLEDKTARIEEKLARSEATTQRVVDRFETASHRMSEVAQQQDLVAVRGEAKFIARRVKALPTFPALILSSVVTALLTAILTVLIIRYLPGLTGR